MGVQVDHYCVSPFDSVTRLLYSRLFSIARRHIATSAHSCTWWPMDHPFTYTYMFTNAHTSTCLYFRIRVYVHKYTHMETWALGLTLPFHLNSRTPPNFSAPVYTCINTHTWRPGSWGSRFLSLKVREAPQLFFLLRRKTSPRPHALSTLTTSWISVSVPGVPRIVFSL